MIVGRCKAGGVHDTICFQEGEMKTVVVGTGVIGTIYGWALTSAGIDVTHLVRSGRRGSLAEEVSLDLLDERKGHLAKQMCSYRWKLAEDLSLADGYELVIVPTNAHQLDGALSMVAPLAGRATVLTFTSNWKGSDLIDRHLPKGCYLLGYPDGGGTIRNGLFWTNLGAEVHLGKPAGGSQERLERVANLFRSADMQPDVQENMLHWLWLHNASVIGFAAGFAKHRDVNVYLADRELLRQCVLATKELCQLCKLRGVDLSKYPEVSFLRFPTWLISFLMRRNFRKNESMQRFTAHAASTGSLQETKIHYIDMMLTGKEFGFDMPYMTALGKYIETV
jgi:2-dehydropantoate 2-reductase